MAAVYTVTTELILYLVSFFSGVWKTSSTHPINSKVGCSKWCWGYFKCVWWGSCSLWDCYINRSCCSCTFTPSSDNSFGWTSSCWPTCSWAICTFISPVTTWSACVFDELHEYGLCIIQGFMYIACFLIVGGSVLSSSSFSCVILLNIYLYQCLSVSVQKNSVNKGGD